MSLSVNFVPQELHIEVDAQRVGGGVSEDCVIGPENATDGNIPVFDGESGKLIKDGYGVSNIISNDSTSIPTSSAVNSAISSLIKTTSGVINTNSNSVSIGYSGTLLKAYAIQDNMIVMVDIVKTQNSVTFMVSENPNIAITCVVIYV